MGDERKIPPPNRLNRAVFLKIDLGASAMYTAMIG
jgi:hypothetical protein